MNSLAIYLLAALLAAGGAAYGGWHARGVKDEADQATHMRRAIKQANAQAQEDAAILLSAVQVETKVRTRFVEVEREANKTDLCSNGGADFLRLFNHAVSAANSTDPAE